MPLIYSELWKCKRLDCSTITSILFRVGMLTNCTHIWPREIPNKIPTSLPGGIDDFSFVYIMRIELSFNPGEIFFIIVNLVTFSIQCCWPFQEAICLSWGALWKWRNCCSAWKDTCITTQVSLVVAVFWASLVNFFFWKETLYW